VVADTPAAPQPAVKPAPEPDRTVKGPPKPKPRAEPAAPAQKAVGTGAQGIAGQNRTGKSATAADGAGEARAAWGAAIRARIERRKTYPAAAGGAAGKVTLRLVVAADGRLASVAVTRSSGVAALDRAAVKAVTAAGRFAKAPAGLGQTGFSLPISFAP